MKRFTATMRVDSRGRGVVRVPFDPDRVWGEKAKHHVSGTVGGVHVRGVVSSGTLVLGAAWMRDCAVAEGERVAVTLAPEGPQRADLAPDLAAALARSPKAGVFFDSLSRFYRKAYLRYIDATKRRPHERAARIAEVVELLEAARKERPRQ